MPLSLTPHTVAWWWAFFFTCRVAQATITIMDTGETFASRQDSEYGPLLWKDYQYAGRMQIIEGNLPLCPNEEEDPDVKHRLVIPSDGLPVALLGRNGGCSTLEKLHYIQAHVEPANLVHYLILDGNSHHVESATAESSIGTTLSEFVFQTTESVACSDDGTNKGCVYKRDESIPIHVLRVSYRTEFKLLDYLLHQSDTSRSDGGPRLAIDSRINVHRLSDNIVLAVAALTLLTACLCSLGLLIQGNRAGWFEPPPPPPPPRSNRRRLRREQVKELLPVYRFNGRELEIIPEETTYTTPLLDQDGSEQIAAPGLPPLLPDELDCCSICLDDYEEGDRVRCIEPCNHTFHSKCIGKWLVERSATCPLCKFDLYDSEDEESEEGDEAPRNADPDNAGITRFQAELPMGILEQQLVQQQQADRPRAFWNWFRPREEENTEGVNDNPTRENPVAMEENNDGPVEVPPRSRRSWWQRLLRRRQEPAVESLTEPLLNPNEEVPLGPDVETEEALEMETDAEAGIPEGEASEPVQR